MDILKKIKKYKMDQTELDVVYQLWFLLIGKFTNMSVFIAYFIFFMITFLAYEHSQKTFTAQFLIHEYKKNFFNSLEKHYRANDINFETRFSDLINIVSELHVSLIFCFNINVLDLQHTI